MALRDYIAEEIATDHAEGLMTRREALRRLGLLGISLTAGSALLAACGGGDDAADATTTTAAPSSTTTAVDSTATSESIRFPGRSGELQGAWAAAASPKGGLLVVHENRGLTPHFRDLVGRLAGVGWAALCVDLLSAEGGTDSMADEGARSAALGNAPDERLLHDLRSGIDEIAKRVSGKKIGAVGFCFGGGMVWNLLQTGESRLAAAIPFYGPAPDNPDFSKAKAAVLAIYGALDDRVNASRDRAEQALKKAGLTHRVRTFDGAGHAFFNDTGERYHRPSAEAAWTEVQQWLDEHVA